MRACIMFHNVTSEYDSAFVCLKFWFQLRILEMTDVHYRRTITSLLFLTFASCHAGIFSHVPILCPLLLLLLAFSLLEAQE